LDQPLRDLLDEWWAPPDNLIATIPKGGVNLKYLGHADTTRALTESDPRWTWEPMGRKPDGTPVIEYDDKGNPVGLWGALTVHGVTRYEYGSVEPGKRDAVKELVGDFLRRGAMRFGIAGALWSKADAGEGQAPKRTRKAPQKPAQSAGSTFADRYPQTQAGLDSVTAAGKERYERLRDEFGKEAVDGALAMFDIARFSDLTPQREKVVRASLKSRSAVQDATAMIQEHFAGDDEKAE
jgi:hypothetical protein